MVDEGVVISLIVASLLTAVLGSILFGVNMGTSSMLMLINLAITVTIYLLIENYLQKTF